MDALRQICLPLTIFGSTKITEENDIKVDVSSFGNCAISVGTHFQEDHIKTEQIYFWPLIRSHISFA